MAYNEGRFGDVVSGIERLPAKDREQPEAQFLLGLAELKLGRASVASAAFARVPLGHELGLAARFNGILAALAAKEPSGAKGILATLYAQRKRLSPQRREAAAAIFYNAALAFLSQDLDALARVAAAWLRDGFKGTIAAGHLASLERRSGPDAPAPRLGECAAHYRARRYREARDCFERVLLAIGPEPEILYAVGYAHYQLKAHAAAVAAFERVLLVSPRDGDARFMLGMARAQLGQHRVALVCLEQALEAGLRSESPAEAWRYIAKLRKILAERPKSGWLLSAELGLGYDSYPIIGGSIGAASSGAGATGTGSGYLSLEAALGYRWVRPASLATSLHYRFTQTLYFDDLAGGGGGGRRGRQSGGALPGGEVSYQTHGLELGSRYAGRKVTAGGRVLGLFELSGLRSFGPLSASLGLEPFVEGRWHRLTSTRLTFTYATQWALSSDVSYLAGHAMSGGLRQAVHHKSIVEAALAYRFGVNLLGVETQSTTASCTAGEPCALEVHYGNHQHRGILSVLFRPLRWLAIAADASLEQRRYFDPSTYRLASGGQTTITRQDFLQRYQLELRFRLYRQLHLALLYAYTRNRSNVNAESTGIEEGYDRHRAEVRLAYERW